MLALLTLKPRLLMFATQILRMAGLQLTPTLGGMETRDISVRESAERKTLAAVCLSGALLPRPPSPTNQLSFARCDSDSLVQSNATIHKALGQVFLLLKQPKTEEKPATGFKIFP